MVFVGFENRNNLSFFFVLTFSAEIRGVSEMGMRNVVGISMGYNTVVNDYGKRNKTISLLFGTYF